MRSIKKEIVMMSNKREGFCTTACRRYMDYESWLRIAKPTRDAARGEDAQNEALRGAVDNICRGLE